MRDRSCATERFSALRLRFAVASAALAWVAAPVRAQTQATTEAAVGQQVLAAQGLDDANIDRSWFMQTAMTQPAGSLAFSTYELMLRSCLG